jgi:uncharacterized protein YidB (DUF937 family)
MANDGDNKKKISRWLRPLMFPFEEGEPKATFVIVRHVSVTGKLSDVRTIKISEPREEASLLTLVLDIEQSALDDVEGTGGVQKYVLQGMDETKHSIGRLTLRYAATRQEDETGFDSDSEPATSQGALAMQMRHNEALERIDKAGWGNIINTQRLTIQSLTEQNEALLGKHLEYIALAEELTQRKHERELELLEQQNKGENRQRVARTLTALLPAVVKKLTGADLGPVTDPDTISMRQFLQTINEDELEKIASILGPEKSLALLSMLKGETEKPNDN